MSPFFGLTAMQAMQAGSMARAMGEANRIAMTLPVALAPAFGPGSL